MTAATSDDDLIPEIDGSAPLDLTGDAQVDEWRGVATEDVEDVTGGLAGLLRSRSRTLLTSLLAPHHRALLWSSLLIAVHIGSRLAGPWLIMRGIDQGIPPLLDGGSGSLQPLLVSVGAFFTVTLIGALSFNSFLLLTGRVGQDIVLDLRRRLFLHFQSLSTSFHERYTSGRVISRQTSDVEAIGELLGHGIISLISSGLLIVGIGVVLLVIDVQLALVALSVFPLLWVATRWFRNHSEKAYRATREAMALVIVHFVESLGGIQAVHTFRREPRNQEIFDQLNARHRDAQLWSNRLAATFGPSVLFLGRMTTASVLLYGGVPLHRRRHHHRRARGVPLVSPSLLRADAGAQRVLQLVPVRVGVSRKARRGPCRDLRCSRARNTHSALRRSRRSRVRRGGVRL